MPMAVPVQLLREVVRQREREGEGWEPEEDERHTTGCHFGARLSRDSGPLRYN